MVQVQVSSSGASLRAGTTDTTLRNLASAQGDPTGTATTLRTLAATQADPTVKVGDTLVYTNTVTNNGPLVTTDTTLINTLPMGVTFISATPAQGSCSGTSTLTCNLGDLAVGASTIVTVFAVVTTTGEITNVADVTSNEPDPNLEDNMSNVVVNGLVDLAVTKTGSPN